MKKYAKPEMEEVVTSVQMPLAESKVETGTGNQGAGGDANKRRRSWSSGWE